MTRLVSLALGLDAPPHGRLPIVSETLPDIQCGLALRVSRAPSAYPALEIG
jgi:hypothetical protein